ncbi:transposase [Streptomyces umbrinus]|uniref:Transposase n=1 Tax=Streptomyces umbrinus TaxID=67370 RepID=A0ABU0SVN8_9ACTN|nr:transposase [Streptomyces umbrinus]
MGIVSMRLSKKLHPWIGRCGPVKQGRRPQCREPKARPLTSIADINEPGQRQIPVAKRRRFTEPRRGVARATIELLRRHLIWLGKLPVVTRIVERLVPDELWELFQRVVPDAPSRPQGGGRRRHGDREVLAAIVFVATSGCTWQQLPTASFGPSGATAHRRFTEWSKARVWAKLHRLVLDELGSRGELDWSRCAIDSVNMRALKRGN